LKICLSCESVANQKAQQCGHCGAYLFATDAVHYPTRRGEREAGNPLLGTVIDGKYRVLGVLGRGGLGTVFRAQHVGSLVDVALKVLHPRYAERPEYRRALLPEARRAAAVTHQRCARLLDVGAGETGAAYLAMELVDGQTLEEVVRNGPLPPSHAVDILIQIAEAVEAVHAAGLVHCDLSPRNVMVVARAGRIDVKVLDFGIARSFSMARQTLPHEAFSGFGNPVFSAPEVLVGGEVDPRADVYSFGALAWLLLTGEPPIEVVEPAPAAASASPLRPWAAPKGVPRRLERLVRECLRRDATGRPASAGELRRRLLAIRGGRRRPVLRAAVVTGALAALLALVGGPPPAPPFLRQWSGSAFELLDRPPPADAPAVHVTSAKLATVGFHYGGFAPARLRADLARDGVVLLRLDLRPEADAAAGTLVLSTAQGRWREAVQALARSSGEGAVDLSLVAPGAALLGSARLRVDDEPPSLAVPWQNTAAAVVVAATHLEIDAADDIGLASVDADVRFATGARVVLPVPREAGAFALGQALFDATGSVLDLGAGEVTVTARDRAGNECTVGPFAFARADVAAPHVVEVAGPGGESFVTRLGDRLRLRVRLSAVEAGCTLRLLVGGLELTAPLAESSHWQVLDLAVPPGANVPEDAALACVVHDAAGNEVRREFALPVRDRSLAVAVTPEPPLSAFVHDEVVVAEQGGAVQIGVPAIHRLLGARLRTALGGTVGGGAAVRVEAQRETTARVVVPPLPAGAYGLVLVIEEVGAADLPPVERDVPVRVLPARIAVRVPPAPSRFLPPLLQSGLLARSEHGVGAGPAVLIDPSHRPYLRGTMWLGPEPGIALPIRAEVGAPVLPQVGLAPGRNVLAAEFVDVLGRPVVVVRGDEDQGVIGRTTIADFWFDERHPEPIGEELLVEHGQPARLQLRFPLPFGDVDRPELRLAVGPGEVVASMVTPLPEDRSVVLFELPFSVWSVATQLADVPRDDFAQHLERRLDIHVATPAGRHPVRVRVRTARSTLATMTLGELGAAAPTLAAIRLVPVLAPSGPFAEPVPAQAPPRSMFRPQSAVAVRNMQDFLLQDREFACGAALTLAAVAATVGSPEQRRRCVHHDDPLGLDRLERRHLLPNGIEGRAALDSVAGVDFFQAWALSRLLGLVLDGDPALFRLPFGCELELAAYGTVPPTAASGAAAAGSTILVAELLRSGTCDAERSIAVGDVVPTGYGVPLVGLDFGLREWVLDLPHVPAAELVLREWAGDHATHLARVVALAEGRGEPLAGVLGPARQFGVVRGVAFGEPLGLVDADGRIVDPSTTSILPRAVPGVLRTEQLRRDGSSLLAEGRDQRLARVGFRVAGSATKLANLWGRR
jgi:predicted Ser/Thr protein kinase